MKIRFASINQQKIREVREILEPSGIEVKPFPIRIEELRTEDLYQLVSDKLLVAFKMIGKPVFVEHTGLFINSLNGFPGGLTQIFWDRLQAERFSELIGRLDDPAAEARTLIGYCDGASDISSKAWCRVASRRRRPAMAASSGTTCSFPKARTRRSRSWARRRTACPCAVARWMPSSPFCGSPDASWTSCATPTATID